MHTKARNRLTVERAEKLVFIAGNKGCSNGADPRMRGRWQLLDSGDDWMKLVGLGAVCSAWWGGRSNYPMRR